MAAATTIPKKRKPDQDPPQPISYIPKHDSDSDSEDEDISNLLETLSRDQLISLLRSASSSSPSVAAEVRLAADLDPSRRKLFVHGLGWDTTTDSLRLAFSPFGPVDDVRLVTDKSTGKSKGYGFILFRNRKSARKALKQPQKLIDGRMTSCQLASVGPPATPNPNPNPNPKVNPNPSPNQNLGENMARKLFVGNVHPDIDPGRLRAFFAQFGEIEEGPLGFDRVTGKPRGFALFVYKTMEGLAKAVEEANKNFEGHMLFVQRASDHHNNRGPLRAGGGPMGLVNANPNPNMMPNPNPSHNPNVVAPPNSNMVPGNMGPTGYPQMPDMTSLLAQGLLQQNPALLAMLATAGQTAMANPAAAFGLFNPAAIAAAAFGGAGGGGAQAVAPGSAAPVVANPGGFGGMGNVGYQQNAGGGGFQGPPGFQVPSGFQNASQMGAQQGGVGGTGSFQGGAMGQGPSMARPPVGQMGGYGPH